MMTISDDDVSAIAGMVDHPEVLRDYVTDPYASGVARLGSRDRLSFLLFLYAHDRVGARGYNTMRCLSCGKDHHFHPKSGVMHCPFCVDHERRPGLCTIVDNPVRLLDSEFMNESLVELLKLLEEPRWKGVDKLFVERPAFEGDSFWRVKRRSRVSEVFGDHGLHACDDERTAKIYLKLQTLRIFTDLSILVRSKTDVAFTKNGQLRPDTTESLTWNGFKPNQGRTFYLHNTDFKDLDKRASRSMWIEDGEVRQHLFAPDYLPFYNDPEPYRSHP